MSEHYRKLSPEKVSQIAQNAVSLLNKDVSGLTGIQRTQMEGRCHGAIKKVGELVIYRTNGKDFVTILEMGLASPFDKVKKESQNWLDNFAQKQGYSSYHDYKVKQPSLHEESINIPTADSQVIQDLETKGGMYLTPILINTNDSEKQHKIRIHGTDRSISFFPAIKSDDFASSGCKYNLTLPTGEVIFSVSGFMPQDIKSSIESELNSLLQLEEKMRIDTVPSVASEPTLDYPQKTTLQTEKFTEKKIYIEKNPVKGSVVYECNSCGKFSTYYCPDCGVVFCGKCSSKKILYCQTCGTGYDSGRITRVHKKCGLVPTSKCPQCKTPLIVIYYTRGGKLYKYMLECLSCGWHSAMSRAEGGRQYGVREKTQAQTIRSGISKGYILPETGTDAICEGRIFRRGCPSCHHNSVLITDLLPTIDFETTEAEIVGHEIPLHLHITNTREPCTLNFIIKAFGMNSTVELPENEKKDHDIMIPIPLAFPLGILAFETQLEITLENYSNPCLCAIRIASWFILPRIDVELLSKEMYIGTLCKLPIQVTNLSKSVLDDIRIINEMSSDFKMDSPVQSISKIDPDETRSVIYDLTPLVGGTYTIGPARMSFKIPNEFGTQLLVIKSNSIQTLVTKPPEISTIPGVASPTTIAPLSKLDVQIKRQFEHLGGFVRIKAKVENNSTGVITDIVFRIDVPESYKLRNTEPRTYQSTESAVTIPNIRPNEAKTIAFSLEPLICGQGSIHGDIRFYDPLGNPQVVMMRPLEITVICPLFFTEEEANIAKLKHLLEFRLTKRDLRCYQLPNKLEPPRAISLVKEVIQKHHVRFVSENIQQNPYDAEVWYYGKSKVKKEDFVIVGRVCSDRSAVEIKVGCNHEEQLTGLLAELGADLRKAIVKEGVINSEAELKDLRCPQCGAPIEEIPEPGDTTQCFACDSTLVYQ